MALRAHLDNQMSSSSRDPNVITSVRILFPNKVTFIGSRNQEWISVATIHPIALGNNWILLGLVLTMLGGTTAPTEAKPSENAP